MYEMKQFPSHARREGVQIMPKAELYIILASAIVELKFKTA